MLGWEFFIYKKGQGQASADSIAKKDHVIATWMTSFDGINWVEELVKQGKAKDLGGDGYPCKYTSSAEHVLPMLRAGLPEHETPLVIGGDFTNTRDGYALPEGWNSELKFNEVGANQCKPTDVLVVEVWDQS